MKVLARAVPIATIVGAVVSLLLAQLGFVKLTVAEQIIVGLVALLAIDAFVERLGILNRIEQHARLISNPPTALRHRVEIIHPVVLAGQATTVDVLAVSGISLFAQHQGFYLDKLREGATIRVILLDPSSAALSAHACQTGLPDSTIRRHIASTIAAICPLMNLGQKGQLELRLGPCFAPFSLVASDIDKEAGKMVVEFHVYRTALDHRPHIVLDARSEASWFGFFRGQFETAWKVSHPVSAEAAFALAGEQVPPYGGIT
jgi:hypothetical protein